MLLIAIKIWLLGVSFAHILPKELLYLSFIGLVSYLSISTEPILEKIKGFILNPSETFKKVASEDPGETVKYFICLAIIYAILATVMVMAGFLSHPILGVPADPLVEPLLIIAWAFVALVFTLIIAVIFGFWLHLWVYILGGRKGIWQTEKVVFYSLTPMMLIGWILYPYYIGAIIGTIGLIVLGIIGIRELQKLSASKAAIAVIVAVVIGGLLELFILHEFLVALFGSLPLIG